METKVPVIPGDGDPIRMIESTTLIVKLSAPIIVGVNVSFFAIHALITI